MKGFSKLLVCGGYDIDTCEVISLESSATTCKDPPNFPTTVSHATGGLLFKENPIICGGAQNDEFSNSCFALENNEWVSTVSMNSERMDAATAQLQDGKLLVTGGWNDSNDLSSAEMLTVEGWDIKIPSLPYAISAHCMVTVNSTTVMVIAMVYSLPGPPTKTFYFTLGEASWTEGPELKQSRDFPSCGKIRRDKESQEMSIIVAGGYVTGPLFLSSVEILHEGSNEWQTGPELPFGIWSSQMVEDQNGGVVLIGGAGDPYGGLDTLFQLPHGGLDAVWSKMAQKLKTTTRYQIAFLVPDNIVDCS